MLVAQYIVTRWTKRTRGAEGRELRARLPRGFVLPEELVASAATYALHRIVRDEADAWATRATEKSGEALPTREGPLRFRLVDESLEVSIVGNDGALGAPARRSPRPESLGAGERLDVVFNGRHQQYDEPWYEEHIVHIAYRAQPSSRLFLAPSSRVSDLRVDLW